MKPHGHPNRWAGYTIRVGKNQPKDGITLRTPKGRAIGWANLDVLEFWEKCYCPEGATVDDRRVKPVTQPEQLKLPQT